MKESASIKPGFGIKDQLAEFESKPIKSAVDLDNLLGDLYHILQNPGLNEIEVGLVRGQMVKVADDYPELYKLALLRACKEYSVYHSTIEESESGKSLSRLELPEGHRPNTAEHTEYRIAKSRVARICGMYPEVVELNSPISS